MIEAVSTPNAPQPLGHYAQGLVHGGLVYVSGQLALDAETGQPVNGSIEEETALALRHIEAILRAAGAGKERVLKTTVYLTRLEDFAGMNAAFGAFFGAHRPARATVRIGELPKGLLVEIDAVAALA